MKRAPTCIVAIVLTAGMHIHGADSSNDKLPGPLLDGLGDLHRPVTTKSKQAQRYFDQGMRLLFAFNHKEAVRSFRSAADDVHRQLTGAWLRADVKLDLSWF